MREDFASMPVLPGYRYRATRTPLKQRNVSLAQFNEKLADVQLRETMAMLETITFA